MSAMRPLPEEGLDLRQELFAYQALLVDQALERTGGDRAAAARLLRTNAVGLERLRRFLAPEVSSRAQAAYASRAATPASEEPTVPDLPKHKTEITRSVIGRLDQAGNTPGQIAMQLGVSPYFVEKILRGEAELRELDSLPKEKEPP